MWQWFLALAGLALAQSDSRKNRDMICMQRVTAACFGNPSAGVVPYYSDRAVLPRSH